jgi:ABC-type uncharacterized transport system substrate-binding protein
VALFLPSAASQAEGKKFRIAVVSSYHREYLWSQDTNRGVVAALLEFKYLDNEAQAQEYTVKDAVESSRAVLRKFWMDSKRNDSEAALAAATARLVPELETFAPDLLLLGDDNAAQCIGGHYLDSDLPVVFWGINGLPLKYGLLDSLEKPGHNVTGVYQTGYLKDCFVYFKKLVPSIQTFAVLADASETARAKTKELEKLARQGELPLTLTEMVVTNSLAEWKARALALQDKVDAFFVTNHNTLKDEQGKPVDQLDIGAWYLTHILKPDCGDQRQFVEEGMLACVDDSGFKQGYEAVKMAHAILAQGRKPADIPVIAPERGPFIVNRMRARMLGLEETIKDNALIEEYVDTAAALKERPAP